MSGSDIISLAGELALPLLVAVVLVVASCACALALARRACDVRGAAPALSAAGFALLLCACFVGFVVVGPKGGLVAMVATTLVALAIAVVARRRGGRRGDGAPLAAALAGLLGLLGATGPYVASGRFGIPGVGVNDDSAVHLYWILHAATTGRLPSDVSFVYPIGPHLFDAAILQVLPDRQVEAAFVGMLLAAHALLATTAFGIAIRLGLPRIAAIAIGAVVPLAYLSAAYAAQGAYKEPMMALLLVGLAGVASLSTGSAARWWALAAAGVVLAAACYLTLGVTGLAWPAGFAVVAVAALAVRNRGAVRRSRRVRLVIAATALLVLVVLGVAAGPVWTQVQVLRTLPQAGGNIQAHLPFVEVFGIWLSPDFRFAPTRGVLAGVLGGIALVAFVAALAWWWRRGHALVAALAVGSLAVYGAARFVQGPYWVAKLLAIAAPLTVLVLFAGLLGIAVDSPRRSLRRLGVGAAAVAFAALAVMSTGKLYLAAPVSSLERAEELEPIREVVGDEPVLYLGQDYFIDVRLRSANVAHLYPYSKLNRTQVDQVSNKPPVPGTLVDYDAVTVETLDRFEYVVTANSDHQSRPPENWDEVERTDAYRLYRRTGATEPRSTTDDVGDFAWELADCDGPTVGLERPASVRLEADGWRDASGAPPFLVETTVVVAPGTPVAQEVDLARGTWDVVLQYQSPVPVTVVIDGHRHRLPAEPDIMGQRWPVARIDVERNSPIRVEVAADRPPLRASGKNAMFVDFVATPAWSDESPAPVDCGDRVDWLVADAPDGDSSDNRPPTG